MLSKRQLFLKYLGQTSDSPYMLEIDKAEGIYLYSSNGEKYIDLISGVSVSNLGHGNEAVKKAIIDQLDKHCHLMVYGEYIQNPQIELAAYLCSLLPDKLNSAYLVNSGSEAIDASLKLAKRYTGRSKIVSFKNSYHGSTHGALSVTGYESFKNSFRPLLPNVFHINYNSISDLDIIDEKTACVIIEPIQAEAGIIMPDKNFIVELHKRCKNKNVLLIYDEIQTGFGRTGKMFAFQHFNLIPDIVCFAKALGGGMPIGALVADKKIMNSFKTDPVLGHITTFGGHPVSSAAALAGLKEFERLKLVEKVDSKGELFKNLLSNNKIKDIRGRGLFIAVEVESFDFVLSFVKKAISNGLITDWFIFNTNSFRIAPPLTISENEIIESCKIINKTLNQI